MLRNMVLILLSGLLLPADVANGQTQITFRRQAARPGQTMVQHAFIHTESVQTYEQSNQIISETDREVRNTQVRNITTLAVKPPVVEVTYAEAYRRIGKNRFLSKKTSQPVERKTYRVTRVDDELQIADSAGNQPPQDELRIVESTMSWVGRPNPLADFLDGRTVSENEQLVLPASVASKIFGGAMGMRSIQRATLTLVRIKRIHGDECAEFRILWIGTPTGNDAKQLDVRGTISVQVNTCRTVVADVKSDLDASEERGPAGAIFTVKNRGKVHIAIKANFRKSF